jgi:cysteine synthase A
VSQLIGHTPLITLSRLAEPGQPEVLVKHEGFNPGGSIRDRTVLEILDNAFASGLLRRGDEVVVAGASNSAVAACVIGQARGCRVTVFHPKSGPHRLVELLRRAGATLIETNGPGGLAHSVTEGAIYARQHIGRIFIDTGRREALKDAIQHIAREIIEALEGQPLGAFVTSCSTGATLRIVSQELRVQYPELEVVGVTIAAPAQRQGYYDDAVTADRVPAANPPGAQSVLLPESAAWRARGLLARTEGLLLGPKGASAALTALRLRPRVPPDRAIVALSIDGGQRYLGSEPKEIGLELAAIASISNHPDALAAMRALIEE